MPKCAYIPKPGDSILPRQGCARVAIKVVSLVLPNRRSGVLRHIPTVLYREDGPGEGGGELRHVSLRSWRRIAKQHNAPL